jgi:hypothetical protein
MMNNAYKPLPEVPVGFKPKENDIIGPAFTPPYRFLFENLQYDQNEQKLIQEFKMFDIYSQIDPSFWTDANILRFIQGSGYNLAATKINVLAHQEWRNANLVNIGSTFHEIEPFLVI